MTLVRRGWTTSLVLVAACGGEATRALPEVSWASEDFEFATDSDDLLCAGTLLYQQRFVELAQGIFGEPLDGQKFTYYLLSVATFEALLGDLQGGYVDAQVFTKTAPEFHETTHAVVDLSLGQSHPFFNEGIAEVFRDRYMINRVPIGSVDDALALDGAGGKLRSSLQSRLSRRQGSIRRRPDVQALAAPTGTASDHFRRHLGAIRTAADPDRTRRDRDLGEHALTP